ncbi:MAG: FAD binding domain-containing protein, partial [Chloroflexi bacterium]|nr:FAD binding domain-containing protein [Chloroflexota bacterium]
ADSVPVLIALGAKLKIAAKGAERTIGLEEFFTGEGRTVNTLQAGEILTEIQIPKAETGTRVAYLKYRRRKAIDFPLASAAVAVHLAGAECQRARIVLGAVRSAPARARQAENLFQDATVTDNLAREAGALAAKETAILSSSGCSAAYRKHLVEVLVERALMQATR